MKSAAEMEAYSRHNGFFDPRWNKSLSAFAIIEKRLLSFEQALICFSGWFSYPDRTGISFNDSYAAIGLSFSDSYAAIAVTNSRLIIGKGTWLEFYILIDIENITGVSKYPDGIYERIYFHLNDKTTFFVRMPIYAAYTVFNIVNRNFAYFKVHRSAAAQKRRLSTADAAAELVKYKKLLDDGVITQAEFNAKKAHLLNLPKTVCEYCGKQTNRNSCPSCGAKVKHGT